MSNPQSQSSPSRPGSIASIPLTYSMESDQPPMTPSPSRGGGGDGATPTNNNTTQLSSAYAFQRSGRTPASGGRPGSIETADTTEDSIDQTSYMDRSVDYTEDMSTSGGGGTFGTGSSQQQQQRQHQMGIAASGNDDTLNQFYQYQEDQEGYNNIGNNNNLGTDNEYHAAGLQGMNNNGSSPPSGNNNASSADDATNTIYQMHKKLLHLLSSPELFHDALDWQEKLDSGFDPTIIVDDKPNETGFDTEFENDSTFQGLGSSVNEDTKDSSFTTDDINNMTRSTQNETFEFNPNNESSSSESKKETPKKEKEEKQQQQSKPKKKEAPLPHQIFAADAEVVLPQALTASQLFGLERVTGIELEAAAGITGLSQLFLRWLALMPEGDHMNIIDPPGLTVMKISGGGNRVTGAHRVVWRWMNKFSPTSTGQSANDTDFDFGDLVTMTIVDVFETDVNGKLLSYCPTFDNRAVHKTPESLERLRKGAVQFKETMEVVAKSPAGKSVETIGRMSYRAAMVVGNAVRNKIQQQQKDQQKGTATTSLDVPEEEQLNELLQSQIATDETDADINATVNATALEEDPTSSPSRQMLV